jgi:hypothetical protein
MPPADAAVAQEVTMGVCEKTTLGLIDLRIVDINLERASMTLWPLYSWVVVVDRRLQAIEYRPDMEGGRLNRRQAQRIIHFWRYSTNFCGL